MNDAESFSCCKVCEEEDESVGDVCGIEPSVLGIETLAPASVRDAGCDKDSPAAHFTDSRKSGWQEVDCIFIYSCTLLRLTAI